MAKQNGKQPAEFIQDENNLYVLYHAIEDHLQKAKALTFRHIWEDCPYIEVHWEPAVRYRAVSPECIHKYQVHVDGITPSRDWEIIGETMEELRNKLAVCLDEYAESLERAAQFLRGQAKHHRLTAAYEAERAKRPW